MMTGGREVLKEKMVLCQPHTLLFKKQGELPFSFLILKLTSIPVSK